jgi:hypothetical protein
MLAANTPLRLPSRLLSDGTVRRGVPIAERPRTLRQ